MENPRDIAGEAEEEEDHHKVITIDGRTIATAGLAAVVKVIYLLNITQTQAIRRW